MNKLSKKEIFYYLGVVSYIFFALMAIANPEGNAFAISMWSLWLTISYCSVLRIKNWYRAYKRNKAKMTRGEKFDYVSFCIMLLLLELTMFVVLGTFLVVITGGMETCEVYMFLLLSFVFLGTNEWLTHTTNKLSALKEIK